MNQTPGQPLLQRSRTLLAIGLGALLGACGGSSVEPPRFEATTVDSIAAVRDNQTGVVWAARLGEVVLPPGSPHVASLPTATELLQLTDLGTEGLRPNFGFVLDAPTGMIQVRERVNGVAGRVWAVDVGVDDEPGGLSDQANALAPGVPDVDTWYVLSRRSAAPTVSYQPFEDTVTAGGLTWKRCSEGRSWDKALSQCTGDARLATPTQAQALAEATNTVGFSGAKDWRVPTRQELRSLLQLENDLAATNLMPPAFATDTISGLPLYWSSSRSTDNARAWQVDFSDATDPGGIVLAPVTEQAYVRLVRTAR